MKYSSVYLSRELGGPRFLKFGVEAVKDGAMERQKPFHRFAEKERDGVRTEGRVDQVKIRCDCITCHSICGKHRKAFALHPAGEHRVRCLS